MNINWHNRIFAEEEPPKMTYEDAYRKYFTVIVKYSSRQIGNHLFDAEEIASDAFYILFEKWDELNSHEEQVIITWLYRAANNKIKEYFRNKPPEHVSIDSDDEMKRNVIELKMLENESDIDIVEEAKKYDRYIVQFQNRLNQKEAQLFEYIVVNQYRYSQIASLLNISESAVKMRWFRLQMKIRSVINDLINKL